MIELRLEDAAQATGVRPNSLVLPSIVYLSERHENLRQLRIADQGSGRLRHLEIFATEFGCTYVVDTRLQMFRKQVLYGRPQQRAIDIAKAGREDWCQTRPVTSDAFERSDLQLDAVFSVCVYDVLPSYERGRVARAALRNLKPGGTYIVIAPRNDASILARCFSENAYDDGHVFTRYGKSTTFFTNYRSSERLASLLTDRGFELLEDRSVYRYVWLLLRRPMR